MVLRLVFRTRPLLSSHRMSGYQLAIGAGTHQLCAIPESACARCLALPDCEGARSICSRRGRRIIWLPLLFGCPSVDAHLRAWEVLVKAAAQSVPRANPRFGMIHLHLFLPLLISKLLSIPGALGKWGHTPTLQCSNAHSDSERY